MPTVHLTLMSGAELFMREDVGLTDAEVEVLSGSMNVFMLASILAAGWVADHLGRRRTLVLANAFLMAGALAMSLGASFAALMAARFVTSVGSGFARVVAPVYNAEISPASTRGVLSSMLDVRIHHFNWNTCMLPDSDRIKVCIVISLLQIFINVGILLSYVSNYAFAGLPVHLGWRVMYGIGVIPPVFIAAGVLFIMPESPRWLVMQGRHGDARGVLLRTSDAPAEADLRLGEMKRAVVTDAAEAPPSAAAAAARHGGGGGVWKELFLRPSTSVRRILACVLGLQFFVQASGVDAILLYSPLVFKAVGMASNSAVLGATVAIGAVKTCFILVGMLFTDRLGRRPLLLASTAGVAVTSTVLAVTLYVATSTTSSSSSSTTTATAAACLASVLAVVATYSIGYGSVVSAYTAEVLPLRLRAQGSSLGVAVNRLTCGVVSMTFISLADGIVTMPGCFFLYAAVTAAAFVFVYTRLPETKGRSLEDMEVLFHK
ncbi:polyol transporter 5 isoform X4 [Sorghum bicolor]|uniref:polyol transporter 5 isoform X4 n=1 Tax=Sorghum bicolor TaxID=4558 RepID=UPI000B424F6E|nr:polyol transporter 5 isoform X4 [Sorghum bicolor]|eukprot:XP_021316510.1 polyol transporter 5 isoform X4 [Sorghum bicolor]